MALLGTILRQADYERIRQTGRERLQELSRPKEPKVEWWTNVGRLYPTYNSPHVTWGTQEMLWPIPPAAKEAEPTERVVTLATPKKNFQTGLHAGRPIFYYSCGRPSMIWEVNADTIKDASGRVTELAYPKKPCKDYKENSFVLDHLTADAKMENGKIPQYLYGCGRASPIWKVGKPALSAGDRPRTQELARPRPPHNEFQPSREVQTLIPKAALSASASDRLQQLSTPKLRSEGPFRTSQWPVTPAALNATSSSRCSDLARPKVTAEGYQLPRNEIWAVTRAAKRANASGRVEELSRPIVRATMDHVQFNPDAFLVKESALKGVIPRRVEELSQPIQR